MGRRSQSIPRAATAVLVAALLSLPSGCSRRQPPVLEPLAARPAKTPVVLIPGLTGTKLRDGRTGRILWGDTKRIFFPRDGGYSLALPLDPVAREQQRLEAYEIVTRFRVLGITVDIYASLIELMLANGYTLGDLSAPSADDTFFVFPYDWRRGNVETAAELMRSLERLRQARDEPELRVRLICQSNAARIARYVMKYGDATLEEAEAGAGRPPPRLRVDKLILVGAANGGALGTMRNFLGGRRYVPLIGRRFLPEVAFTYPAAYESLPAYRDDLFVDERGATLDVDLYSVESWKRYGWSVFSGKVRRRLERRGRPDLFADESVRENFLAGALDGARRLHELLVRDVPDFGETRYYLVQNAYRQTPDRAVLARRGAGWEMRLVPHGKIERDSALFTRVSAPGDGHATVDSQMWLSPQELAAVAREPVYVPVYHRLIMHHPATHHWILEFLLE